MFLKNPLFHFAPAGGAADAGGDSGEIGDDEVAKNDAKGGGKDDAKSDDAAGDDDDSPPAAGDDDAADDDSLETRAKLADLADVWKQHKLDGLPTDPTQLATQYQAGLKAQQEAQELRNQLLWQMHNAQQQQAAARQQQQPAPTPPAKMFNLPEFDKGWLDLVTRDENGNLIAKPGAQPDLPQKINAYATAREQALNGFLENPIGLLQQHFSPIIQQQAMAISQQQLQEYARIRELNQFEQQNAAWVFQNGTDNSQGITAAAQRWNNYYGEALQMRHPQPAQYAQKLLDADAYQIMLAEQAQQTTTKQQVETTKQKDMSFLKRAAAQSNRGQSLPSKTTPKPPQNGRKPFASLAKRLNDLPSSDFDDV